MSRGRWRSANGCVRGFRVTHSSKWFPQASACAFFGVHLSAVHAAWTEQRRVYELRALLRSVDQHKDRFHVLAGDFNTVAPGDPLRGVAAADALSAVDVAQRRQRAMAHHPDRARCGLRRRVQDAASRATGADAAGRRSAHPARLRVRAEEPGRRACWPATSSDPAASAHRITCRSSPTCGSTTERSRQGPDNILWLEYRCSSSLRELRSGRPNAPALMPHPVRRLVPGQKSARPTLGGA